MPKGQMQIRNTENVRLLSSNFQPRYEPNFAWKSMVSTFLTLPSLRGFWPMSSFDQAGNAYDLSGQGRTLTYNGNPTYNFDGLLPYIDLDGTGDFLSRADEPGLDIFGTETVVAASVRGLTTGGYIWYDSIASNDGYIAKRAGANDGYSLYAIATGEFRCIIGTGATQQVFTTPVTFPTGTWHHVVLRFVPSTTISIFVDGTEYSVATAIAAINNSAAALQLGRIVGGSDTNGRIGPSFLCAAALSDTIIESSFEQTRAAAGI